MARSRFIYTLSQVAGMISENLELIEEITANSDNSTPPAWAALRGFAAAMILRS